MNKDIRLKVGFFDHPKTLKLIKKLGWEGGVQPLLRLWMWAAQYRPDGVLSGMDSEDIELAAKWDGEPGMLVALLQALRFLDLADATYSLHDWEDHNGWAAHAKERSEKAKKAAKMRWRGGNDASSNASSNAQSNACGNAPSPSPSPSPNPFIEEEKQQKKIPYGEFKNVMLSEDEFLKLKERAGEKDTMTAIEKLSEYMRSKGKRYKDHYATVLSWLRREGKLDAKEQAQEAPVKKKDFFDEIAEFKAANGL